MTEHDCPIQRATAALTVKVDERGPWIFTASGRRYFPTSPRPEDVDIYDIAWALSHLCRYTGHTHKHISVAQHSVLCASLAPPEIALEALMHDAAEAYLGDVSRPVKMWLRKYGAGWDDLEDLNAHAIAQKFGLQYPWPAEIAVIDNQALAAEVDAFHCSEFKELLGQRGLRSCLTIPLRSWSPAFARNQFYREFKRLRKET